MSTLGPRTALKSRKISGSLAYILAQTNVKQGTKAATNDVAGCTLEMGADGLWTGNLGTLTQVQADALVAAGVMGNVKVGTPGSIAGTEVNWNGTGIVVSGNLSFLSLPDATAWATANPLLVYDGMLATAGGNTVVWRVGAGWAGDVSTTTRSILYGTDQIIQIVGDSTGVNDYTWSGLLAQSLAKRSRVEYYRLIDNADPTLISYGVPSVYGGGTRRGVTPITRGRHQSTRTIGNWTADIDVRVFAKLTTWGSTSQQCFLARYGANSASFNFYAFYGTLRLDMLQNGTLAGETKQSSANIPFAANEEGWVRFTLSGTSLNFYTSKDGTLWTQLGTTITTTTTEINKASLCDYSIGSMNGLDAGGAGSSQVLGGTIYSASVHDGINGPEITHFGIESWCESNVGGSSLIGSPTIRILNGSIPGATLAYLTPRITRIVKKIPNGRGSFIINAGKNEVTGETFVADMLAIITSIKTRFPGTGYIKNQYPTIAPGVFTQEMAQKSLSCEYIAKASLCKLIDSYSNFMVQKNWQSLLESDGVHATQAGCLIDVSSVAYSIA